MAASSASKNNNNYNPSSLAMALAGKSTSVAIPKPRDAGHLGSGNGGGNNNGAHGGRDSFAAVAARSLPMGTTKQPGMLLTPPNSISPSLPPQAFQGRVVAPGSPPAPVDSDIDLQDAVEHAKTQDQPMRDTGSQTGLVGLDSVGAITPSLLAKHHLPEILLTHGPLAIRHVMSYLTTSVPGFSRIPPAKARRLVVGALEGRGSGGEGGGLHGDVLFEKVGWGRWDARMKGHAQRERRVGNPSPPPSASSSYAQGLQIPNDRTWPTNNGRTGTSMASDLAVFSHSSDIEYGDHDPDADIMMLENEADKMSLDGEEDAMSVSSSEPPDDGPVLDEELGDVTDEEDWASIGAAALRAGSMPQAASGGGRRLYNNHLSASNHYPSYPHRNRGGGPASSALAKSMPPMPNGFGNGNGMGREGITFPDNSDDQERDAIAALLSMGGM